MSAPTVCFVRIVCRCWFLVFVGRLFLGWISWHFATCVTQPSKWLMAKNVGWRFRSCVFDGKIHLLRITSITRRKKNLEPVTMIVGVCDCFNTFSTVWWKKKKKEQPINTANVNWKCLFFPVLLYRFFLSILLDLIFFSAGFFCQFGFIALVFVCCRVFFSRSVRLVAFTLRAW